MILLTTMSAHPAHSVFYPPALVARARENIRRGGWAAQEGDRLVAAAQPWMRMPDDELWQLMFGNTIRRSWMVWSNGFCPACKQPVPMYTWEIDALRTPWKVRCPHCGELFPKNDFARFYRSGLDEHGIFEPARADRSLLYNTEHPDPHDPLHLFGVDDGEGYVQGDHRWRFIGAYLIYGQWKQAVYGGIVRLAAAYTLTGDRAYAHKALVLLDRVADLYRTFDFGREGVMYEGPPSAGYVSTWHDACEETRELALAWDQVRDALDGDTGLVAFLSEQAHRYALDNPKTTAEDIRRNVEDRILRDALAHRDRIHSNYPRTEIAVATILTVLGWPENRQEVLSLLDPVLDKSTAVDGVTGEKGLAGYTAFTIRGVALLLAQYDRMDPTFLPEMLRRHPRLHAMFRFHVDTHCLSRYYPEVGDSGGFAQPVPTYQGVSFSSNPGLEPSMYGFLWRLYQITGDAAFVQALYQANGGKADGLPYDLFAKEPPAFQRGVLQVIAREGVEPRLRSVNLKEWHLAILRSGQGANRRAVWLEYDSGGPHGHKNGLNLGLFAHGLDLLPDFGYPPVQYGGWSSPRANWYRATAAHNTVVVDGRNQPDGAGTSTIWADGERFHAVRGNAPALNGGHEYERTIALVDVSDRDAYVVDLFRVQGGADHAMFLHGPFGTIQVEGLPRSPAPEYGHDALLRDFRGGTPAAESWSAEWNVEDRYHVALPGAQVRLRCTELTRGARGFTCEAWVSPSGFQQTEEAWIPCIVVRRGKEDGGPRMGDGRIPQALTSTFVSVLEPYEGSRAAKSIRRLDPDGQDSEAVVEVGLSDGRRDLLAAQMTQGALTERGWRLHTDAELCHVRRATDGHVEHIALCHGSFLQVGVVRLTLTEPVEFVEVALEGSGARIVGDNGAIVKTLTVRGRTVPVR